MKRIKIKCDECEKLKSPIEFVNAEVFSTCRKCDKKLQSVFREGFESKPKNDIERMDREREHNLYQEEINKIMGISSK